MENKKKGRVLPNGDSFDLVAWRAVRKRAIASKDHICAICGQFIDVTLPAFDPGAVEVDHIIPISRGGEPYSIDNLQLSHSRCNRQKGNKMKGDYDGLEVSNPIPLSNSW